MMNGTLVLDAAIKATAYHFTVTNQYGADRNPAFGHTGFRLLESFRHEADILRHAVPRIRGLDRRTAARALMMQMLRDLVAQTMKFRRREQTLGARPFKRHIDDRCDAAWFAMHHGNLICEENRLVDAVSH